MREQPIVVGFDNSPGARYAVRWAVDLARTLELPLRVVVARGDLHTLSTWANEWTRGLAEEWTDEARKELVELGAAGSDVAIVDGVAAKALTRESRTAAYLVVGSRGHGAVTGTLQGSVSQHVSRQAECPVVVVRQPATEGSRRVVVGVDASDHSLHALEVALHYAGMHRFALTVVHCSEGLHDYGQVQEGDEAAELLAALDAREAGVLRSTADVIARHEGVEVEVRVATGRPADALARESLRADLVVVGSRGRGAFAGMLLGSVSAEVLQRARCPVAVIR